jgi:Tol biopolymer transport system component
LPENPRISNIAWSPDDTKISFSHTTATGVELWVIEVLRRKPKLTEAMVNANIKSV